MMRMIVASSLRFRLVVVAIAAAAMVIGIVQLRDAPVDLYPEFTPPYVEVQTEALGLSAAEVEQLITVPLEADLLNGVAWLESIRSESIPGLSSITLLFEPGTDLLDARQVVQERLTQSHALPQVSKPPVMLQPLSSTSRVMMIGISSKEDLSLIDLGVLARWNIRPKLMGIPGVANVAVWGQRERQLQVLVDPERLREQGVSLLQVVETTGNAQFVSPLSFLEASSPGTGGFIDGPNQRLGVRHVPAITTPQHLAQVTVEDTGDRVLRLSDVAEVVEDHQPLIGDAAVDDRPGLILVVEKLPWANTLEVTRDVEEALEALSAGLPGVEIDPSIYRPASFIETAMDRLGVTLLAGLILMLVALAVLLYRWRAALIVLVAVSLSVLTAGLVLALTGATINAMVLAGLVLALGVVVDDAITAVDAVARRLRVAREEGTSVSAPGVIIDAILEMRRGMLFATLIAALPLLPIFAAGGISGPLLRPLAVSYLLALLASMVIALTVTPALGLLLFRNARMERRRSSLMGRLQRRYEGASSRFIERPRLVVGTIAVLALVGLAVLPFLRQSTVPTFKERDLLIEMEGVPGASLPEMSRITTQASRELRSIPGVRNVGSHVGRAVQSDAVVGANASEIWVSLEPDADYDATVASIREVVTGYPGIKSEVLTYPTERIMDITDAPDEPIVVRIFGEDPEVLREKAQDVRAVVAKVDGIVDPWIDLPPEEPTLEIQVDLDKAQEHGIKPGDVRRAAATLLQGLEVGYLFDEQKVFEVVVRATPKVRDSVTSIRTLLIDTPEGDQVQLGQVASVQVVPAPNVIERDAVSRFVDIVAGVEGRDVGAVAADVERRLAEVDFPLEYHAELLGEYDQRQATQRRTLLFGLAAAIGIFLLLQAAFGSWRLATLSFLALPLALVGSVVAAVIGGTIFVGSLAGALTVLGITARNTMMLIGHYQDLQRLGGEAFGPAMILRGARERLGSMLATAVTVGVAFLPFAVRGGLPGHEILHPMALVVLGGLVTSTLVNLFVVPALYLRFGRGLAPETDLSPGPVPAVGPAPLAGVE